LCCLMLWIYCCRERSASELQHDGKRVSVCEACFYLWVNASPASFLFVGCVSPPMLFVFGFSLFGRLPFWSGQKIKTKKSSKTFFKDLFIKCFSRISSKPRKALNVHAGVPNRGLKGGAYATSLRAGPIQTKVYKTFGVGLLEAR
jgi:hypothetical protein